MLPSGCSRERWLRALAVLGVLHQWLNLVPPALTLDETYQIVAARSFLQGYGFSLLHADPQDLLRPLPEPVVGWPPGLALAFAMGLRVWPDIFRVVFLLKAAGAVLFFAATWGLLAELRDELGFGGRALILFWWAFLTSPLSGLPSADLLALAAFQAALALTLRLWRDPGNTWVAAAAGLCLGAAAAFRYAYWPLALATPLGLAMLGRRRRRRLLPAALLQLGVAGVVIVLCGVYGAARSGHATYLTQRYSSAQAGFYPQQVRSAIPFPAQALGLDPGLAILLRRLGSPGASFLPALLWATALLCITLSVREAVRSRGGGAEPAFLLAGLAFAITLAMLVFLTVRYPPDAASLGGPRNWVFLQEYRYYAPGALFLFLGLGRAIGRRRAGPLRKSALALGAFLGIAAASAGLARAGGTYYDLRYLLADPGSRGGQATYRATVTELASRVEEARRGGLVTVCADTNDLRLLIAATAGARMLKLEADGGGAGRFLGRPVLLALPKPHLDGSVAALREQVLASGEQLPAAGPFDLIRLGPAPGPGP